MVYSRRQNCMVSTCFGQAEQLGLCKYHYELMVKGGYVE